MTDPIALIGAICSICENLYAWLDNQKRRNEVTRDIGQTVERINNVVSPFRSYNAVQRLDESVIATFRALQHHLSKIQEHLEQWQTGAVRQVVAFVRPGVVLQQLREDERDLTDSLVIVLFSVTLVSFFGGQQGMSERRETGVLIAVTNEEVKSFWRDYIGAKVVCAQPDRFIAGLKEWFTDGLKDSTCRHLLLRLDEYNVGGVTPSSLQALANGGSLQATIVRFKKEDETVATVHPATLLSLGAHRPSPFSAVRLPGVGQGDGLPIHQRDYSEPELSRTQLHTLTIPSNIQHSKSAQELTGSQPDEIPAFLPLSSLRPLSLKTPVSIINSEGGTLYAGEPRFPMPLLVWIDDVPDNNRSELTMAHDLGITIVLITSTAMAKAWFEANKDFVHRNDRASRIRVITDNVRKEKPDGKGTSILNISAGENILRYLRGRHYRLPVLVYSGVVEHTRYVSAYSQAGSTNKMYILHQYVTGLAKGYRDDKEWQGYDPWAPQDGPVRDPTASARPSRIRA